MMEIDFSGDFINELNVADNDVLTIVSEPISEQKESPTEKIFDPKTRMMIAKKYLQHTMSVDTGSSVKTYKVDNLTGIAFQKQWGKDSSQWIGKTFSVKLEPYTAFGKQKVRVRGVPLI